jgi:hypothetical protein
MPKLSNAGKLKTAKASLSPSASFGALLDASQLEKAISPGTDDF